MCRNYCLNLEGQTYAEVADPEPLSFGGTEAFTFEGWVRPMVLGGVIISKFNSGVGGAWYVSLHSDGIVNLHREVEPWNVVSHTQIQVDVFSHIAVSYNRDAENATIYINGKTDETTNKWGPESSGAGQPMLIGARLDHGNQADFFQGQMAEFRVWKEYRTQNEIQNNMHTPVDPDSNDLVAYWPMILSTGSLVLDIAQGDGTHKATLRGDNVEKAHFECTGDVCTGLPVI